MPPKY